MPLGTRKIGKDDVSEIGFGAMGISAFYGKTDSDEERFKVRATWPSRSCSTSILTSPINFYLGLRCCP